MKKKVTVIDYGVGNLLSIKRAFEEINAEVGISNDKKKIINSSYLVLPGVGAFHAAMDSINNIDLVNTINEATNKNIPFLGVCLGAQLIFTKSQEFKISKGLNLIEGEVISIKKLKKKNTKFKIPHIGWKKIIHYKEENKKDILLNGLNKKDYFYFVHSYVVKPKKKNIILCKTIDKDICIPAIIKKKNLYGCQFHPEKSGKSGLKILRNFLRL